MPICKVDLTGSLEKFWSGVTAGATSDIGSQPGLPR